MKKLLFISAAVLLSFAACRDSPAVELRDGDIIFQTSRSDQSLAIRQATHSKYSHMGIILYRNGKPYVYEAVRTVRYTPLDRWISRGEGGHYVVKRLRGVDRILTRDAVRKLREVAGRYRGKPYDLTFEWSDDRMYCSELVWKIYDRGLGVQIGKVQRLRDFDLSAQVVKAKMRERYGSRVLLDEKVISPQAMYSSDVLADVVRR